MRIGAFAVIAALVLLGAGGASADTVAVRLGIVPSTMKSLSAVPDAIAEQQGFFARQDIKLVQVPVAGGTGNMVKALDRGDVDLTDTATPYFIEAVLAGSNDVGIAAEVHDPVYSLIVRPEIRSFGDLRGKTLGLSLAVDTISITTRRLLARNGLKDGDYKVKELVGTPLRLDCLKSGACDGVPLGQPEDFDAVVAGYRRLGVTTDAVRHLEFTLTAARRDWAASHKDILVRYLRAVAATFRYMHASRNRDAVAAAIVQTTGTTPAIAHAILALYFDPDRGVIPRAGEIDTRGLAQVIAFMGDAGIIKKPLPPAQRFIDETYLRLAGVRPVKG